LRGHLHEVIKMRGPKPSYPRAGGQGSVSLNAVEGFLSYGAAPGSVRSNQSAITLAMASLFFSSIIMWPLP
jgi:hypothetical protein